MVDAGRARREKRSKRGFIDVLEDRDPNVPNPLTCQSSSIRDGRHVAGVDHSGEAYDRLVCSKRLDSKREMG